MIDVLFVAPALVYPQSKTVPKKPSPVSAPPEVSAGNDPEKFCSICHASFNNPLMSKQHYVGKKHKKQMTKVKLMEHFGPSSAPGKQLSEAHTNHSPAVLRNSLVCNTCKPATICYYLVLGRVRQHGAAHTSAWFCGVLMQWHLQSSVCVLPSAASTVKGYPCSVCNIELNSVEQYQAHISGAKHKNK